MKMENSRDCRVLVGMNLLFSQRNTKVLRGKMGREEGNQWFLMDGKGIKRWWKKNKNLLILIDFMDY